MSSMRGCLQKSVRRHTRRTSGVQKRTSAARRLRVDLREELAAVLLAMVKESASSDW